MRVIIQAKVRGLKYTLVQIIQQKLVSLQVLP